MHKHTENLFALGSEVLQQCGIIREKTENLLITSGKNSKISEEIKHSTTVYTLKRGKWHFNVVPVGFL